jgi:hypothetical protein
MIKKLTLSFLVVFSLLVFFIPGVVRADSGLAILDSSASIDFPARIIFNISAGSGASITDLRLHYVVDRMEHAKITSEVYIGFTPAKSVKTQWVWDMRKTGGLPPGSNVDYWWTVTDASENKVETIPARIHVEDGRYSWRNITQGKVTLYWYQGDNSFAGELMAATQQALTRLAGNTGAELESPVRLYIYANADDLRGSMIYPQEWTGGVSFTPYGVIAIGIAPNAVDIAWGKRAISHELTHLVIHQVTFNPYNDLPTWLDEGLAMVSEGELEPDFTTALSSAEAANKFISVRSLASPFSAYAEQSVLAYAESERVVAFLIDNYRREKMFALLNAFEKGSGYDEALNRVYGFDMDGLNALWQASLKGAAVK